jgi:molecular chaperone HscB
MATAATTEILCWSCNASVAAGAHFCAACGKIQPLPPGTDYFAFFGLPRKLQLDAAELEKRFHELSWKLHPDNFVRAGESERALSLERSSQLNDAFRTLREPVARVEHLLAIEGARKEGTTKQQAPPELLEEVFELNESLDELRAARSAGGSDGELAALRAKLEAAGRSFEQKLREVDTALEAAFARWDAALDAAADAAARRARIAELNEILNRRSYIRNLVRKVSEELTGT